MHTVLMFLGKGFEGLEAATMVDVLGWTRLRDTTESIALKTCAFHDQVEGRFGVNIAVDINLQKQSVDSSGFDALVVPGGFHSHGFDEAYSEDLHRIARAFHERQKPIATLCVGVLPIADAGLLEGKKATTYGLSELHNNPERLKQGGAEYTGKDVEFDGGIISCAGPANALEVAFKLVELLTGEENLKKVKALMIA
jgi:4-methyl-5(b-hydroxyethyl)-thiazole monophosphate biosynthesis